MSNLEKYRNAFVEGLDVEEDKITDYKSVQSKNREKKINYGLRLFAKHMRSLWY